MSTDNKKLIVDPPTGWKYGFPREMPQGLDDDEIKQWFIDSGYPKESVDLAVEYSRYWYVDEEP